MSGFHVDRRCAAQVVVDWEKFGAHLADAMRARKLTCRDVQVLTGVPFSRVAKIQRGERCELETYLALCLLLDHLDPFTFAQSVNRSAMPLKGVCAKNPAGARTQRASTTRRAPALCDVRSNQQQRGATTR